MKKAVNISYLLLFLLILIIPLCLTNVESNVKSDFDNRVLIEMPEIGETRYEQKVTSFLQDRIGLRDQIVTGYQLLNNVMAGELTHPIYTYGQNGYMFFGMHNNINYGTYHKTFAEAVFKMQQYCESRGVNFYFLFDPEKISVYRRYLPQGVNYSDEWVDEFFEYMENMGIHCINNRDLLIELSYQEQVFNHQYDAGHWNDLGCFYGTNNLWKTINKDFPSVTEYTKDDFDISIKNGEFLAASKFPVNEEVPKFTLKTKWTDKTKQYSGIKLNNNYQFFQYYTNTSDNSKAYPRMLVFHGSYYNRGPQFFVGRAQEYIGVHDYQNVLNLDYYFNIFQPDLVIFEVAEYTFFDNYFNSSIMANLDYNPSLVEESEGIEMAINSAQSQAEEYSTESKTRLCIIQQDGFDTIYIDKDLSTARYVYLFTDEKIFDLQKNEYGFYSTGIPHGAVFDKATLYYEDYMGNTYYSQLNTQQALSYIEGSEKLVFTEGASYNAADKQYELMTTIKGNVFNQVNMQLLDGKTGEYLEPLLSTTTTGTNRGYFIHQREAGLYYIRLKGNTNKKDEAIDVLTYLIKGKKYYYSFDLAELTKKRIKIKNYELFGPINILNFNKLELIGRIDISQGAIGTKYSHFTMKTELENNVFNSVVLQLNNTETGEYIDPIAVTIGTGVKTGWYYHDAPTGTYFLKLRANSNKKDEFIGTTVELQQFNIYEWSYEVEIFSTNEIVIKDFSFKAVGVPFE